LKRNKERRPRYCPHFEVLEDRVQMSAVPVVTVTAPATSFIGTDIPLSITFSNPSASGATNPGYSPWDYVILPRVGFQGSYPGNTTANAYDGVSFNTAVTPTYLGAAVTYQEIDVPMNGQVTGPAFAASGSSGAPIMLTGLTPGDQVVFFQMPFGSYAVDQPGGVIDFGGVVSNLATVNQPLTLTVGGGFSLGNDALSDPSTDPPLLSGTTTAAVTPTLFTVTKTYLGPENETATGPNFVQRYQVDVSVAPGQTLTNFQITDLLPNSEQWVGAGSTTGTANGGTYTGLAGTTATTTTPGGTLIGNFTQVVGTGGPTDATFVYSFYVPELDATNAQVLNLNTGNFENITNSATGTGDWTPIDTRDTTGPVSETSAPVTITAKSIAVQKSVAVVGGGPVVQGATLQYTINFQISDYFAFNELNLADLLPDGVRYDAAFTPTLFVVQHTGNSAAAGFQSGNVTVGGVNADGSQTLNFNVSGELTHRNDPTDGDLIGGDIPAGGTGSSATPPGNTDPSLFSPGTTGQIVFEAIIQQDYSVKESPEGSKTIKQGDTLTNVIPDRSNPLTPNTGGQVLSYANLTGTGTFQADTSSASVTVAIGSLSKSIYAINGSTSFTSPAEVQAGDTVTYQLIYTTATGTMENLLLTDYLPLPIFDATDGGDPTAFTFDNISSATAPAEYTAQFGPTDQYLTRFETGLGYSAPTVSTPTDGTNRAIFTFPVDLQDPQQRVTTIDILFTVPVEDKPFADGLFLTNQAESQEGNTDDNVSTANNVVQLEITQPNLTVDKSVVASSLGNMTFGSVSFNQAQIGTANQPWTGTINSNALTRNPINADLSGVQAGDEVEFAIIVQNTGMGVNGAFDVELNDTLPTGYVIPGGGLDLQVRDGAGTAIPFTDLGAGLFDPAGGIQLTDPSATQGSLTAYNATSGANIAVITFDLQLQPDSTQANAVQPGETLTNTAAVNNYAAMPGGVDYLSAPLTDTANVTVTTLQNTKSIVSTSEASTTGSNVVIGEIVRYQLVVKVPQSSMPSFQIVDQLPTGLGFLNDGTAKVAFVSGTGTALSSSDASINGLSGLNITGTSSNVTPTAVFPSADISGGTGAGGAFQDGDDPVFSFSNLIDNDTNDANSEFVVLDFNALVDNVATNVANHVDANTFYDKVSGAQVGPTSAAVDVTVVEPYITTTKTVPSTPVNNGDSVTYTLTYTNTGGNDAFDANLTDTVPSSLTVTGITVTPSAGVTGVTNNSNVGANSVNLTVGDIPVGGHVTVTVTATVASATVSQTIPNTANATWTSLPGAGTPNGTGGNNTGSTTPGASGAANGERNGSTGPISTNPSSLNDYASSGSVNLNIISPALTKSIVSTSEASTTGSNVAIGEIVRYQLAVQIPQAVSPSFQIVDQLPAGMSFLNDGTAKVAFVSSSGSALTSSNATINGLSGLNFTGTSSSVTPTAAFPAADISGGTGAGGAFVDGNQPVFSFSNITNSDTDDANAEYIVLDINALVDNVSTNTTGHVDTNTFITKVSGAQAGPTSGGVSVTVVQPYLTTTKTSPETMVNNGVAVSYTLTFTNTGNNDAFDANLTDTVPSSLTVTGITVTQSAGVTGVTNNSNVGTNSVNLTVGDIPVGDNVTVTVDATVTSATVGQTIPNTANATWTSLPGTGTTNGTGGNNTGSTTPGTSGAANGERNGSTGPISTNPSSLNDYASNATYTLDVTNPTPIKTVVATSEASTTGTNVAIGEIVRYHLVVQLPKALTPDFQIVDQLPAGLSFFNDGTTKVGFVSVSGSSISSSNATINSLAGLNFTGTSSNITPTAVFPSADISGGTGAGGAFQDGDQPIFSFSNITDSDANTAHTEYIVLEFNALVDNVAVNTTGHADANTFIDESNGVQVGPAATGVSVTIVQPLITNTLKTVTSTGRDPGDTVTYQVTYSNTGNADAFDAQIIDNLPATLSLNTGSITETLGGGASGVTNTSASNSVNVTIGDVPVGGTVQIHYSATILTTDAAASVISNTANLTYTSLPGTNGTTTNVTGSSTPGTSGSATGERNGSGGLNSYYNSSSQSITINESSLSGIVYLDLNNNGVDDGGGETGISGVTVTLTGTNFLGTPVNVTTTTNASGQYTFTGLLPSNGSGYKIAETQPAAYLDGKETPPTSSNFTGTIGSGSNVGSNSANDVYSGIVVGHESDLTGVNYNFGELPPATVSGTVYIDDNDDGVQEAGDTGISGVQVELHGTDDRGDTVTLNTTTNSSGNYSFATLRPGTYFITVTQPTGYLDGLENQGNTAGGVIAGSDNGQNRIPLTGNFSLGVGATSANNMFGELQPASLAGFVYVDANNDGIKEAGELGIAGVTVTLTGTNDLGASVNVPTTTLADGSYSFTNLRPGTYTITETQPAAYEEGKDTIGTPGGNATVQDVFSSIVLAADVSGVNNNFGESPTADLAVVKQAPASANVNGTITYTITVSNLGPSAAQNVSLTDPLPAGVTFVSQSQTVGTGFTLTEAAGTVDDTIATFNAGASATFQVIVSVNSTTTPGTTITNTASVSSATADPDIANNTSSAQVVIGVASLSGSVYIDVNNNGNQDPGDPGVAGVTILLTGTNDLGDPVSASVVTDVNGNFSFQQILPGTYTLTEIQPINLVNGITSAGVGVTTDGVAGTNVINGIVVGGSQNGTTFRFGERGMVSSFISKRLFLSNSSSLVSGPAGSGVTFVTGTADPSGYVYLDVNHNGIKDAGEPGIAGVQMILTGVTDAGAAVKETEVTNAVGFYQFAELLAGVYTVTEVQPTGYSAGQETLGSLGGTLGNHQISNIVLGDGEDGTGYNFGQLLASPSPTSGPAAMQNTATLNPPPEVESGETTLAVILRSNRLTAKSK
jgi:uncharacterized repeat protein (TIGR01451 family)